MNRPIKCLNEPFYTRYPCQNCLGAYLDRKCFTIRMELAKRLKETS